MNDGKTNVSFVIVTWNSKNEIAECIRSVKSDVPQAELIIVDNHSSDGTIEILEKLCSEFSGIRVILNEDNFGYTKACNQAMKLATGDYIFLLNPDTILTNGVTGTLISSMKNEICAAAPQLINDDGSVQFSCRTFPRYRDMYFEIFQLPRLFPASSFFNRWKMGGFSHDESKLVDQPMAAALKLKREILAKVGFMDERFFMFFNDVDLCKSVSDAGGKILFNPDAKISHSKGVSVFKVRKQMIDIWKKDCLSYFEKYFGLNLKFYVFRVVLSFVTFIRNLTA